jgi:hypothetical protein
MTVESKKRENRMVEELVISLSSYRVSFKQKSSVSILETKEKFQRVGVIDRIPVLCIKSHTFPFMY